MPANPLHFSAIAPLYFRYPLVFDIKALLYSSTLVDLELVYFFFLGQSTFHGFWHSYLFVSTVYPLVLSTIIYVAERRFEKKVSAIYRFFRLNPIQVRYSFKKIYGCCLIGGISHVFFDSWTHQVSPYIVFPFFYNENPFWIGEWSIVIDALLGVLSLYTIILWIKQNMREK